MSDSERAEPYVRGKVFSYQSCQAFSVCSMNHACIASEAAVVNMQTLKAGQCACCHSVCGYTVTCV